MQESVKTNDSDVKENLRKKIAAEEHQNAIKQTSIATVIVGVIVYLLLHT